VVKGKSDTGFSPIPMTRLWPHLPEARRLRRLRGATLALALVAIAGCSGLKFGYNRLDWIASWQLGRFVDLEPEQKRLFNERFRQFWQWHRSTQLTLYVRDLRALVGLVDKPLDTAQVEQYLQLSQDHVGRMLQEAVPDTARVLQTLDDAQVAELAGNMAERRDKRAKESAELTAEELREEAQEQMEKALKRWIGPVNRDQRRRIADWAHERQYAGTVWHQYEAAWANAFTETLAHRRDAAFQQRLAALFDNARVPYREEMEKVQEHNRQAWIGLMADLSASLDDKQRRHLREQLGALAGDLEELAAQAPG
jgi:Family of unknown function (DUF6279)